MVSSWFELVMSRNMGGSAFSSVSCSASSSVLTEGCELRVKQNLGVGRRPSGCMRMRSSCSTNSNSSPSAYRSCIWVIFLFCCSVFQQQRARSQRLSCRMSCSRFTRAQPPYIPVRRAMASPVRFYSSQKELWIRRASLWQNLQSLGQKKDRSRVRLSARASAMGLQDLRMKRQTAGSWLVRAVTHRTRFIRIHTSGAARVLTPPRRRPAQKSKSEAIFCRQSTQGRTMSSSRNISLLNSTCSKRSDQSAFRTADLETFRSLRALVFFSCSQMTLVWARSAVRNSKTGSVEANLEVDCSQAWRKSSALMALRGVRVWWVRIWRCCRICWSERGSREKQSWQEEQEMEMASLSRPSDCSYLQVLRYYLETQYANIFGCFLCDYRINRGEQSWKGVGREGQLDGAQSVTWSRHRSNGKLCWL